MTTSSKNINKVLKGILAAMPAIPYLMKSRRRTSVTTYVLSGVGFAVAGGIVALMLFSPRTRTRALNAAKGTYGKMNEKLGRSSTENAYADETSPVSNGLSGRDYSTTGGI